MSFKVKTGKRVVLVGTYRAGQLERWPGYYNYPLNAGDAVDAGAAKRVEYLGLWDTVDATPGLAVAEDCPANVRFARHAVAEHEARCFYAYVPLRGGQVEEALFPGVHSDVGGLYEDDHALAGVGRRIGGRAWPPLPRGDGLLGDARPGDGQAARFASARLEPLRPPAPRPPPLPESPEAA